MPATVWLYGEVGHAYHDVACGCADHCGNCWASLDPGSRRRYCSTYCQGVAKRDRALDRLLESAPTAP